MLRLLLALICMCMVGCGEEPTQRGSTDHRQPIAASVEMSGIEGEWMHGYFMGHKSLVLKPDGTFTYFMGACLGEDFSAGRWEKDRHFFVLTSDEKYKHPKERVFVPVKSSSSKVKSNRLEVELPPSYEIVADTNYIYFDRHVVMLQGDTLMHLTRGGEPYGKYARRRSR